jgi:hypothetical protein
MSKRLREVSRLVARTALATTNWDTSVSATSEKRAIYDVSWHFRLGDLASHDESWHFRLGGLASHDESWHFRLGGLASYDVSWHFSRAAVESWLA